ncbi:MAG: polysaccharide biosynthesis tyrosine autokinase [Alloacidobacterium sp.]|jgi:succinoglycan biosynthesis transport protein ExoP
MDDNFTITDLLQILRRRRHIIAVTVVCFIVLAAVVCIVSTRRYQAEGTLQVQKESSDMLGLSDMMGGAAGGMDDASDALSANITIQTQANILQSDTLALRVINDLNMEQAPGFKKTDVLGEVIGWFMPRGVPDPVGLPLEQSPHRRAKALKIFSKNLDVKPVSGTRLITISYSDPDPKLAAAAINRLMQDLISYTVETRFTATNQASEWLNTQLGDLKKQAEDLQAKVMTLQRESGVFSLGTPDATGKEQVYSSVLDRLQQATAAVTAAESNRILKGAIYQYAKDGNAEMISGLGGTAVGAASPLNNSLQLLQNLRMQQATVAAQIQQDQAKFGENYPKLAELNKNKASLDQAIQQETERIANRAQNDFAIAQKAEQQTRSIYEEQRVAADRLNDTAIEYAIVRQEADDSRSLYEDLLKRLKEAGVMEGLKSTNLTVVDPGRTPDKPDSPNVPLYLAASMGMGLFFGITGAVLLDALDNKIRSEENLDSLDVVLFGILPSFDHKLVSAKLPLLGKEATDSLALPVTVDPKSPYAEALRSLALSITMARGDRQPRSLLITSSIPGEGKTETSVNIAVLFAQRHKKVLLVEADMRRPRLRRRLKLESPGGLSSLLSGSAETVEPHSVPGLPNLHILHSGPTPPDPAELLESDRMKSLLDEWSRSYDMVILDSAPILAVSDAGSLANLVDLSLVITRFNYTTRQSLKRCLHNIRQVSQQPIGVVLNGMEFGSNSYYEYYGYKGTSYYGEETA